MASSREELSSSPIGDTPVFHIAVPYLEQENHRTRVAATLSSITAQTACANGHAHLRATLAVSGASADFADWVRHQFPNVEIDAKPDEGMYDALARVFRGSRAHYFGWLGAGDTYEPTAFSIVLENAPSTREPYWITGLMRGRRSDGTVVRSFLPFRYRRRFFENGIYGTALPTIQQESTFWNNRLHSRIDFDKWRRFQFAGDFYLWQTFSKYSAPIVVEAALGSFTWHGDNKSQDYEAYLAELASISRPPRFWEQTSARFEKVLWALHPAIKTRLARGYIRRYNWPNGPWS